MIVGHYATALVPYSFLNRPRYLWLLLLCSNLADFLWIGLGLIGLERPVPSSLLDGTFQNLSVDMLYSHDAVPTLVLAVITFLVVYFLTRAKSLALWCGALVIGHLLSDLLSGYQHHLMGHGSGAIGLDLYHQNPTLALVIEAAFGAAFVAWYLRREESIGRKIHRSTRFALYAVFIGGALAWIPLAKTPLRQILAYF